MLLFENRRKMVVALGKRQTLRLSDALGRVYAQDVVVVHDFVGSDAILGNVIEHSVYEVDRALACVRNQRLQVLSRNLWKLDAEVVGILVPVDPDVWRSAENVDDLVEVVELVRAIEKRTQSIQFRGNTAECKNVN